MTVVTPSVLGAGVQLRAANARLQKAVSPSQDEINRCYDER